VLSDKSKEREAELGNSIFFFNIFHTNATDDLFKCFLGGLTFRVMLIKHLRLPQFFFN